MSNVLELPRSRFTLDEEVSSLLVETRATGMLARLAHDLQLRARGLSGTVDKDEKRTTKVELRGLTVVGVRKNHSVDERTLSPADKDTIEERVRKELFASKPLLASATLDRTRCTVELTLGGSVKVRRTFELELRPEGDRWWSRGGFTVSLAELRVGPILGPLGAFRVDDSVEVRVELRWSPARD